MRTSLKARFILGTLFAAIMLTTPTWAANQRSGVRGQTAQPVSRQDAFFGQTQSRQDAYFSQPVFPQQPFNQNATILPPAYFSPMQLNYQGAPTGIIPGTGASFNPVFNPGSLGFQPGFGAPRGLTNMDVGSATPIFVFPMGGGPAPRPIQNFSNRQSVTQIMPRMGLLGRW